MYFIIFYYLQKKFDLSKIKIKKTNLKFYHGEYTSKSKLLPDS